ncbi:MAG TPA: hypothetical protein PLN13_09365 [Bacteroidia bacterium]|nr:hypothetical protein [Bacteroidia bacterium]HRH08777.1 hypothetical protein [Bacteroidia bacterium]
MDNRIHLSRERNALKEQYLDLIDDCRFYDMGNVRKAKDISGRLRVLLKDGPHPKTVSLLRQLELKDIAFYDSSIPYTNKPSFSYFNIRTSKFKDFKIIDENLTEISPNDKETIIACSSVFMGLVGKKVIENQSGLKFSFIPLHKSGLQVPELTEKDFETWWEKTIIFENPGKQQMSRKDLILSIAEQDGFAHFDKEPDETYLNFNESDALKLNVNGTFIKFTNSPAKASVRQIGYEIIKMLEDKLPNYLNESH